MALIASSVYRGGIAPCTPPLVMTTPISVYIDSEISTAFLLFFSNQAGLDLTHRKILQSPHLDGDLFWSLPIWQERAAKILKFPRAPRNVHPALQSCHTTNLRWSRTMTLFWGHTTFMIFNILLFRIKTCPEEVKTSLVFAPNRRLLV